MESLKDSWQQWVIPEAERLLPQFISLKEALSKQGTDFEDDSI